MVNLCPLIAVQEFRLIGICLKHCKSFMIISAFSTINMRPPTKQAVYVTCLSLFTCGHRFSCLSLSPLETSFLKRRSFVAGKIMPLLLSKQPPWIPRKPSATWWFVPRSPPQWPCISPFVYEKFDLNTYIINHKLYLFILEYNINFHWEGGEKKCVRI